MDLHYSKNPEELLQGTVSDIIMDLENPLILEVGTYRPITFRSRQSLQAHLQCAGTEMPITSEDEQYFGPMMKEVCENRLSKDEDGW